MGKLTSQLSTWRKENVECKKGNVTTLWFKDTQPNIMFVQNDSDQPIYISIDHIPTRKDYAFNVKPHNSRLIARPYKTGQIYVLNDGGLDASITVWSIYDTFRPEMLQDFTTDKIDITTQTSAAAGYYKIGTTGNGSVNRAAITDTHTAGWLEAKAASTVIGATSLISNSGTSTYYIKKSTGSG